MVKVVAISALMLALIVGIGWFYQAPKPAAPAGIISPIPLVPASTQPEPVTIATAEEPNGSQTMAPEPPRQMTERSDFLSLAPGDRVSLQGGSSMSALEDYVVAIESVANQPASLLIKGLVEGGGAFIATLGPTTLNIFLQSDKGLMRYAGADFNGLLSPLQMINLDDDIRQRLPPKVTRLESSNRRAIESEMR